VNVFEQRGIQPVINAAGTLTRLAGGLVRPEVAAAMAEAARYSVNMVDLQAAAAKRIAEVTGAESGYVTSGASAGLLLATAACLTRLDPARMAALPDIDDQPREVLVARGQRNSYDHALRAAGARLVEVGLPDRASGAGIRDAEPWEYAEAVTTQTVAIYYVASREARPALSEVAEVARAADIPLIVDAAAELPPQSNLQAFIAAGADLVVYSGGKAIGGPQASGILCGRRDLIMAAALQHLDMDVRWDLWNPPPALIDKTQLKGLPRHGIGRSCKVGKEEVIGLLTALDLFVAEGDVARHAGWLVLCRDLADGLSPHATMDVAIKGATDIALVPKVELAFAEDNTGAALQLVEALQAGAPAIHTDPMFVERGVVVFNPMCLRDGDTATIIERVLDHLADS